MNETLKHSLVAGLVALVVAGGLFLLVGDNQSGKLGATYNTAFPHGLDVTSDGCYAVDGTCVIDENGNVDAPVTSTTGSFTGAVDVGTFTQGGGTVASSTSDATATALESYFDTEIILEFTPNVDTTLTLPATSTITDWIPNAGDSKVTYIKNASSTAAASLTIAAGTGIDIQEPTGADLAISGLDWARLTWIRESDTDIVVIMDGFQEGD